MEGPANEESDRILREAAAVAQTSIDDKFPTTPIDSEITESSTTGTSKFM
jgi:hypothetical protein